MGERADKSRRAFLKEAATILGISLLPFPRQIFEISKAMAATNPSNKKRQHLIHMVSAGGWATEHFYNFFDPALNSSYYTSGITSGMPIPSPMYGTADSRISIDGHKLAPGMSFWTASDLNRLALWKGAQQIVSHGFNQVISGGGASPYNASYSSIIAAYQAATRGPSVLHYVKLTSTQAEAYTSPGMLTGYAIPSCIPNNDAFQTLTTPQAGRNVASLVDDGVGRLSAIAKSRLSRDASVGVLNGFASGYQGSKQLSQSNYANSGDFKAMWFRYFLSMKKEGQDQLNSAGGFGSIASSEYVQQGRVYRAYHQIDVTPFSSVDDMTNYNGSDGAILYARSLSWYYAMSAFLVINDLSSVVDFQPTAIDGHVDRFSDFYVHLFAFTGYRELIRHLGSTPNPEGGNMLDCTLISYCSEFDREPLFNPENGNTLYGTNHGESFSVMLAGHRSNGGKVIGGSALGDLATNCDNSLKKKGARAIPVDSSGHPSSGGKILSPLSLLPTVLSMFGATIPLQQVTENLAISALVKSS